jgi:hypothetical protein
MNNMINPSEAANPSLEHVQREIPMQSVPRHRLEPIKINLAVTCFVLSLIAAIGLPALVGINLIVYLIYSVILVFPLLGYALLWGYWQETRRTHELSSLFWHTSFLYNIAGVIGVTGIMLGGGEWWLPVLLFWTVMMSLLSLWAAILSTNIAKAKELVNNPSSLQS